ncbi:hypothetical protein SeSB_A1063 [Salmonella enterica subsp. enterica serovar Schwarzengrund str. SL480]|uniref:Uncharacterized protein n=1 Tax=Salmonella schwarzengrund (strain CVM19633) TaxID=439843 RepID=A0A0N1QYI7_SALSV|nr:hypothetical protein SeSA_A0875 [Salmonella enterica subsp. enterica serovar Schwarzengrund str. CVM19633]EDY27712.1 hypothetical protein SeSB_A1063 [Salmonella enterica subsp. enterica serovar Schwarzengrund str. SL480]EHC53167.1 hypothetical protein LTSEGIV_1021 [Salmonella enterica subsp. enterica serovar Give str. S5-487]
MLTAYLHHAARYSDPLCCVLNELSSQNKYGNHRCPEIPHNV